MGHHQFPVYSALSLSLLLPPSFLSFTQFEKWFRLRWRMQILHRNFAPFVRLYCRQFSRTAKTNPTESAYAEFSCRIISVTQSYTFEKRIVRHTSFPDRESKRERENQSVRGIEPQRITRISFRDDVKSNKADSRNTLR